MNLNELNYPKTDMSKISGNKTADETMASYGFEKLGNGMFGSIYAHPNLSYVVKVFFRYDRGYKKFYELVKNSENPHFPKFKGSMMAISTSMYGIRMEKLEMKVEPDLFLAMQTFIYSSGAIAGQKLLRPYMTQFPELEDALTLIYKNSTLGSLDLHDGNIMFRGNVPVIIDPWR